MGLTQRTAIVMVLSILSQIVCCVCMPQNHSKSQLKSNAKNINSQNDKSMKNTALLNNLTAINNLEAIRFPNVEYPFDSDIGECYRFLNNYSVQGKPKVHKSNISCQVNTNKIETKYKRKIDRVAKAKSKIKTSFTEYDSEESFFPEMEYPLSARDMWIPNYRSRLQDVKRNGNVETDKQVDRIANNITDPDYKYENWALKSLIKTLNTKATLVTKTPMNDIKVKVSNTSKPGDILDVTIINTRSQMNIDNDPGPSTSKTGSHGDIITVTVNTNNNATDSKVFNPREISYKNIFSNQTSVDNSHVFSSKNESINDIVTTITNMSNTKNNPQLSIAGEDKGAQADAHPEMLTTVDHDRPSIVVESGIPIPQRLSRPIDNISTECSGITITPDYNVFNVMDYYNSTPSMIPDIDYFDFTDATTAAPFEYVTFPMSSSATLTNKIMFDQPATTAPNPTLTTNSPKRLGSGSTLSNQVYSILAHYSPQNCLDNDQGNFTKNWTLNPNDSYTTRGLPKDSDDWVIYVDNEKTFPSQENFSDYTMIGDEDNNILCTYFDGLNYLGERSQISNVVNSTLLTTPDALGDESNRSQEVPNNYPVLNITNSLRTITKTGNVDISNSLISSCHSCSSSTSSSMQTENYQSRDYSTNTSIIVPTLPEHMGDSWILVNSTENPTQSVEGNEYKSVYIIIENNTSEEPILKTNDTKDQLLYFKDSSSTLQYEYVDDASASVTEIPYDMVL